MQGCKVVIVLLISTISQPEKNGAISFTQTIPLMGLLESMSNPPTPSRICSMADLQRMHSRRPKSKSRQVQNQTVVQVPHFASLRILLLGHEYWKLAIQIFAKRVFSGYSMHCISDWNVGDPGCFPS